MGDHVVDGERPGPLAPASLTVTAVFSLQGGHNFGLSFLGLPRRHRTTLSQR